ncbi:hypothetical protein EBU91_00045 [bacterium]|nr:hypothetical protein [bacterium]
MNSRYDFVKCSVPNCCNKVGYHRAKNRKFFDGFSIRWKAVCEKHRNGIGKDLTDSWKLQQGCNNHTGKYGGVPCVSVITHPSQLEINHIDGNNLNRDANNIEVLCSNCHRLATMQQDHHMPKVGKNKIGNKSLFPNL